MKIKHALLAAALIAYPATSLLAQSTYQQRHDIAGRKGNQQGRIAQGEQSGQLTHHEASHLEHQEHAINHEERGMRAQDNGHLTAQDRHTLASQQNAESQRIYNDKHNLRTQPGVAPQ